ncbi:MAG TPA: FeS-binding protein [Sulfurihydrogenibium sp.]|jgi:ABC-type methionine transport system ATPase subunit|uniref:NIL domain-containing protein n=1 Tax=unclassified Sulfurihydrogenibium TaxID=2619248 RepID=UPI0001725F18|nr:MULTISPECIES: NIL domain-containing protein [unclassified Sulfurihydrogenibium]ACD66442.1 iron-sulfur cluster-binding protein [Sulfurihydrogenibium sp. YO3AOP1]HBT98920.1 FeS-binding protein [Sulfurihydrogenibium sp.]
MNSMKLKLIYPEEKIKEPLLSKVCKNFNIDINIRKANVQEKMGWLELEFIGNDEEIEKAINFLVENGVEVQPIEGQVFIE